ncbi:MAG: ATP-binding protein [Kiritimatiellales bacterium]
MWIDRKTKNAIVEACGARPAILLTGARQTGKSSLLQKMFPDAAYVTLDHVPSADEAEANPDRFLNRFSGSVILDEVQYAPSLFRELKIRIDKNRSAHGRWILTGSQRFSLMKEVGESLAGRISVLQLETLSAQELRNCGRFSKKAVESCLWKGGYPELWANQKLTAQMFYEAYIQTYLEKDLRAILNVSNIRDFRRFIQICAARVGQLLNYADLSKDSGVSAPTIKSWISVLEASGIINLLPPFFANIGKRLVKAPKLYFSDTGLLSHLLNITDADAYTRSSYKGSIWENFVFTELVKTLPVIPGRTLFFYRDQNHVEIDFVVELGGNLCLIEAKAAERVDSRKLNFSKVAPLFPKQTVSCVLMNMLQEKEPVHLDGYDSLNPLHHTISLK